MKILGKFKKRKPTALSKKKRNARRQQRKKYDSVRAKRYKMVEYDRAVELCPAKQIVLNRENLAKLIVIYDLETAGFRHEQDILQVKIIQHL